MEKPRVHAAGKAASTIAASQRPPNRRWDRARSPPDRQRPTFALDDPHEARVATQPPDRLWRERGSLLEFRTELNLVGGEALGIHMHHDLAWIAALPVVDSGGQGRPRQRNERVRAMLTGALGRGQFRGNIHMLRSAALMGVRGRALLCPQRAPSSAGSRPRKQSEPSSSQLHVKWRNSWARRVVPSVAASAPR